MNTKKFCKTCSGAKVIKEVLDVHVEKGMKDGQVITFRGKANQAPNTLPQSRGS
ncbi:hypothetical protein BY996DRAFT_6504280 [Phakopsora pachyrhizi]|nr:hypothetical protein BY996DRAFT_6504280 [Phakopsora pachyrhizi]